MAAHSKSTRTNLPNANIHYAMTSRDVKSYESAILKWAIIGQSSQNANIDYAMTSRHVNSSEAAILKWAIIGQTCQTLIFTMQ